MLGGIIADRTTKPSYCDDISPPDAWLLDLRTGP